MTASKIVAAAASSVGGGPLNTSDVFSTHVYKGSGSTQSINNGIDLSGKGGLTWIKARTATTSHVLFNTERGFSKYLVSDANGSEGNTSALSWDAMAANNNGFTLPNDTNGSINGTTSTSQNFVSWTWRKAEKFFDIVTYTGTGSTQTINHNLGSAPGMIIIKRVEASGHWEVYHRSTGATGSLNLNSTSSFQTSSSRFNDTEPTSTQFTVKTNSDVNASGGTYIAYLFAHNNNDGVFGPNEDQDIIKCGKYTGNGNSSNGTEVNLGFEPQFLMVKRATGGSGNWLVIDTIRGWSQGSGNKPRIQWNTSVTEANSGSGIAFLHTGFKLFDSDPAINGSSEDYIYMAIRRDPLPEPENASEVFEAVAYTGDGTTDRVIGSSVFADLIIVNDRENDSTLNTYGNIVYDRVRGENIALRTSGTNNDSTGWANTYVNLDEMKGWRTGSSTDSANYFNKSSAPSTYISWHWKRAPGYFDIVSYTGNGGTQNVSHNLGVVPEMIWVKCRDQAYDWRVYHSARGNDYAAPLNGNNAFAYQGANKWNATTPTASVFSVGSDNDVNQSNQDFIAYLFATVAGVSKVGSFTGDGNTGKQIDCGFTNGASFILIKRADDTGHWFVWDSARGIVAGNDPYHLLNATDSETTGGDNVDPYSAGFIVNGAGNNVSGGEYIFYAIAATS
jgi:hypothetical protein